MGIRMEADTQLLNTARTFRKEGLVKIFDLYSAPIYCYALRLCGDPVIADQVVGDVFAKLLDKLASGQGPTANLRSYLYEIAYHQVVDEKRSSRRMVSLEVVEWLPQDVNASDTNFENQMLFQQILGAIRRYLTTDQRHVVILRFMEGFSLRETAAITGKKVSNVKVLQNRAIVALRKAVDPNRARRAIPSFEINKSSRSLL